MLRTIPRAGRARVETIAARAAAFRRCRAIVERVARQQGRIVAIAAEPGVTPERTLRALQPCGGITPPA